jgi:hypothetical protein
VSGAQYFSETDSIKPFISILRAFIDVCRNSESGRHGILIGNTELLNVWKMKKGILAIVLLALSSTVFAQSTLDTLRFSDLRWSSRKKAAVLNYMQLTEADKSSFWPVFDSYNTATRYLELESIMILKKYSDGSGNFSPLELEEMSQRILKNDLILAKLRKQFYKRFKIAVSPEQATAFFQLDTMFRSMMRLEAQRDFASQQMLNFNLYTRN